MLLYRFPPDRLLSLRGQVLTMLGPKPTPVNCGSLTTVLVEDLGRIRGI